MNIKATYIERYRLFDAGEISEATYQTAEDWKEDKQRRVSFD